MIEQRAGGPKYPWYAGGLNFTCTQCGNCCGGAPGFVWIERDDILRIAGFLKITPQEMVERYCRTIHGRFSLNEGPGPGSDYDCVFLGEEESVEPSPGGQEVAVRRRFCSVYPVRPLQCRTWPFWRENLSSPKAWDHAARRCHGMSDGSRKFTAEQIHAIRDAEQWPVNPPTSAATTSASPMSAPTTSAATTSASPMSAPTTSAVTTSASPMSASPRVTTRGAKPGMGGAAVERGGSDLPQPRLR